MVVNRGLTLREEHTLRLFEKSVLKIFRPKGEEVTEDVEYCIISFIIFLSKYYLCDQIKKDKLGGVCILMGEIINAYRILV
jgi:hypothetical protein